MYYAMLIAASFILACNFAFNKLYQRQAGTGLLAGLRFNALLGFLTTVIMFFICGCKVDFSTYSLVMALIFSTLVTVYTMIGFRIMKNASIAVYTLFLMTGGMLVPYLWGIAFLNEGFVPLRLVGTLIIVFAVVLSNFGKTKIDFWTLIMCVAVFALNGFVSVSSKLHQVETEFEKVGSMDFVVLVSACKFVVSGIAYLIVRFCGKQEKATATFGWSSYGLMVLIAGLGGISSYLQFISAAKLPATVVYPILTGGTMILSAIAGVICFRDKLTRNNIIALILCFIGTVFFL